MVEKSGVSAADIALAPAGEPDLQSPPALLAALSSVSEAARDSSDTSEADRSEAAIAQLSEALKTAEALEANGKYREAADLTAQAMAKAHAAYVQVRTRFLLAPFFFLDFSTMCLSTAEALSKV